MNTSHRKRTALKINGGLLADLRCVSDELTISATDVVRLSVRDFFNEMVELPSRAELKKETGNNFLTFSIHQPYPDLLSDLAKKKGVAVGGILRFAISLFIKKYKYNILLRHVPTSHSQKGQQEVYA